MKKFIVAALAALVAAAASIANARDDAPSPEVIKEFAFNYMRQFSHSRSRNCLIGKSLISWLPRSYG